MGHGVNGYDPMKKQYVSVWCDSMMPSPSFFWGTMDEKTKTLTMTGDMVGEDGKDAEMVKIEYTRKKK